LKERPQDSNYNYDPSTDEIDDERLLEKYISYLDIDIS
jgi:hypothetical protein